MHFRNTLALAPAFALFVGVCTPTAALASDEKESCLAAADQGQSFRDDGKYSVAREQFVICSRSICPKLVHDQCTDWLRQLDESIPTVVFVAKDDQGNDVTASHVLADEKPVATSLDGKPLRLDPGPHDVRFERDNPSQSISMHVVLRAGEKNRVVSAAFPPAEGQPEKPSDALPAPSAPPASPTAVEAPAVPPPSPPRFWNTRSVAALSLLGAGAVSVGLGVVFGLLSQSEASQGDSTRNALSQYGCGPNGDPANPKCKTLADARDAQNRDATLNIAFYVGGGALAAGAVAAWLLLPKPEKDSKPTAAWITPVVLPGQAGVNAGGSF